MLERAAFPPGSHNEKALIEILETYPRDELFQISVDELFDDRDGDPPPRRAPAAAPVRAPRHRSGASSPASCSSRATASTRRTGAASRRSSATRLRRGERSTTRRACPSPCSCACTTWPTSSRARCPTSTPREIEMMLVAATRSWADDLEEALVEEHGEERGGELLPPLRRRLPGRLPRRLGGALGARRHRAHRGAARGRRPRRSASTARSRRRPRRAAREAVPRGPAAGAVGHAAAVREHGRAGRRRAPLRDRPARPRRRLDLRLRPHLPGGGDLDTERRPRELPGRLRARLARRGRERRLQPAGPARRAHLARDHGAARDRQVPAPGRHHLQRPLRRAGARGAPEIARLLVELFQARFDPRRTDRADAGRDRRADRRGDRRRREPRPGPHPAQLPRRDPGDAAHELLPARPDGGAQAYLSFKLDPTALPLAAAAAPALRDLRLLAAHRGRAPARRQGGARRPALVGPARGLPHRGARPDEGADGEERGDRAGRARRAASW